MEIPMFFFYLAIGLLGFTVIGLVIVLQGHKFGALFDLFVHKFQKYIFYAVLIVAGAVVLLYFSGKL